MITEYKQNRTQEIPGKLEVNYAYNVKMVMMQLSYDSCCIWTFWMNPWQGSDQAQQRQQEVHLHVSVVL